MEWLTQRNGGVVETAVARIPRLTRILVALLLCCAAGCASVSNTTTARTTPALHSYACAHGSCSGLVDIGGKRKVYVECRGTGAPTVVLIAGRSDRAQTWQTQADPKKPGPTVFSGVARFARVCAYDRPGTFTVQRNHVEPTSSTPVSQPTTAAQGVNDLHALLAAAKVHGPYLMVAHSYGGLIARLYASSHPGDVSGLVLVDTLTELMFPELGSMANQLLWLRLNNNYSTELDSYHQERTDLLASFDQLENTPAAPSIPGLVLSADQPFDFKALIKQGILPSDTPSEFAGTVWRAVEIGQHKLAALLHAEQITDTNSGHYIHLTQPQLVINSIRHVDDQILHRPDPAGLTLTPAVGPA